MHKLHQLDYAIIILYLVATTIIGMILTRRASKSLDHYFLGDRSMPWWLLGIAGMSNWFDLTGTMMITSFLFLLGPRGLYIEFRGGACLILPFLLAFAGKWHRRSGCMTGLEWMIYRYGRSTSVEAVRLVSAILAVISTIFSLAYLVRGTSLFLGIMLPYPPMAMTTLIVGLTALYTMFAGFYGVVITDMIQGVIIIISCMVIAVMAWRIVPDTAHLAAVAKQVTGNADWLHSLPAWHTTMPHGYEMYQSLMLFSFFYLLRNIIGGMASGAESRYFGARNDRECGLQSMLQAVTIMFRWPLMAGFAVMGIYLVYQLFPDQSVVAQAAALIKTQYHDVAPGLWHDLTNHIARAPQNYPPELIASLKNLLGEQWATRLPLVKYDGIINPEQILPAVLLSKVPMGLAGFIIVAMLAAMKGSLAGMVNGTSAFFVRDIYQAFIRPKAATRELIAASWLSTAIVMAGGLYMGMYATSINSLWGWLVMSFSAGGLAPGFLRLYWWRCNCWGVVGGMVLGTVASIAQLFLEKYGIIPLLPEWQLFLIMTFLSFVGTIGGSLLTAPTNRETLRHFYRTTRPFGLWGPLKAELSAEERQANRTEHRNDILTVPFAMLWQVTMFLMPMQLIIKCYRAFWLTLPWFLIGLAGMYWYWWRNLPPADEAAANPEPSATATAANSPAIEEPLSV
jgi:Na+/proline symporter